MIRSGIFPQSFRSSALAGCKRGHESVTNWCGKAFDDIKRVHPLVNGFPFRVFKSQVPDYQGIVTRLTEDNNSASLTCEQKIREAVFDPHRRCSGVFPLVGTSPPQRQRSGQWNTGCCPCARIITWDRIGWVNAKVTNRPKSYVLRQVQQRVQQRSFVLDHFSKSALNPVV